MRHKIMLCLVLLFVPILLLGNSAEPPSYIIIVPWADDSTTLTVLLDDKTTIHGTRHDKFSESYFLFYSDGLYDLSSHEKTLLVKNGKEDRVSLPQETSYNQVYTLEHDTMRLTPGKMPFRVIFFASIRIVLTLLVEGAIFYAFGFRKKESYILFLLFNAITQGILIWYLHSTIVDFVGYFILGLIITEIIILAVEALLFTFFVKEKGSLRKLAYVFVANLASFAIGFMLLQHLPF